MQTVPGNGECEPGEERYQQEDCGTGLFRRQQCSSTCAWMTQSDPCVDECGEMPRSTANEDEEEVCIPSGAFRRGLVSAFGAEPVQTVMLSAYYIDRYVVTNRRYKACYDAGACPAPSDTTAAGALVTPSKANHPVFSVSWNDAEAYCNWDGGRRLLTEAEWEKAARGPAPRENKYTWEEPTWRCDLLMAPGCAGYSWDPVTQPLTDPYNGLPGDRSYYTVYGLLGAGFQWTHDYFDASYYSQPDSLDDPQGPVTGTDRTIRGMSRHDIAIGTHSVAARYTGWAHHTIRCGRSATGL